MLNRSIGLKVLTVTLGFTMILGCQSGRSKGPNPGLAELMEGATPPPKITKATKTLSSYKTTDGRVGEVNIIEGEAVVMFKLGSLEPEERAILFKHGATILSSIPALHSYLVSYSGDTMGFLEAIRSEPLVELAEAEIPAAGFYGEVIPPETANYETWYLDAINAPQAWWITSGSDDIELCILDIGFGGITYNTADFFGRIVGDWPWGTHEHGGSIAGVATASGNSQQMVGISWSNKVRLKKVHLSPGRISYAIIEAIAVNRSAVINVSLGPSLSFPDISWRAWNSVILGAIHRVNLAYEEAGREAGYVVVFAAGNQNLRIPAPRIYPSNVIYVAGTDPAGERWISSNWGDHIDLAAPASNIGYYDYSQRKYTQGYGTSYSCAMVAGACVLVWAQDPALTGAQVKTILKQGVTPFTTKPEVNIGAGILNIYGALNKVKDTMRVVVPPDAPSQLVATAVSSSQIDLAWTDNADNEEGSKIERSLDNSTFHQIATVGADVTSFSDQGLDPAITYYYRVCAYNSAGNSWYSNTAHAETLEPPLTIPTPPSDLQVVVVSETAVRLYWQDNSTNEEGFRIWRTMWDEPYLFELDTVGADVTTFTDGALNPLKEYYYAVTAFNSAGESDSSNVVKIRTAELPWSIQTIASVGAVGLYTSLALDPNGYPHISYCDLTEGTSKALKYARWTGSEWDIQTVDSGGVIPWFTSIAIDSNGYPHISYYEYTATRLRYARWTGSGWDIQDVEVLNNVGQYVSMALDSSDNAHISYYDATNDALKYAHWTGSGWDIQTVGQGGQYSSIALDSNDQPHISYYSPTYVYLMYAKQVLGKWVTKVIDSDFCIYTSIALDSNGYPNISYSDYPYYLKYLRQEDGFWLPEERIDGGLQMVGAFTSIAMDLSDSPHISYYDTTNGDLKYAKKTSSGWFTQTVDTGGDGVVGWYTSIAIDQNGRAHISYYDYTNQDLKYARQE
jgi:hypothetical protein